MKALRLDAIELYPVYCTVPPEATWSVEELDLPDHIADRLVAAEAEFFAVQSELKAFLAAVHRDEHTDDRLRAVNQARLERGRRRPHRRPRPAWSNR